MIAQFAAKALLSRVSDALKNDQHVTPLRPVLQQEQSKAIDLLTPQPPPPPVDPPVDPPVVDPPVHPKKRVVDQGSRQNLSLAEAESEIGRLRHMRKKNQEARINVSWVIEEEVSP